MRSAAFTEEDAVVPDTSRQSRERIGVRTSTFTAPEAGRFEHLSRYRGTAYCCEKCIPFCLHRQVPSLRANAAHRISRHACFTETAALAVRRPHAYAIHCGSPGVQATVHGALGRIVSSTPTSGIGCVAIIIEGNASISIIEVFRHPGLGANGDGLVGLAVTGIDQCSILTCFRTICPARFLIRNRR